MSVHGFDQDQFFNGFLCVPHFLQQLFLPGTEPMTFSFFVGLLCPVLLCALSFELCAMSERADRREKELYRASRRVVYVPQASRRDEEHITEDNGND